MIKYPYMPKDRKIKFVPLSNKFMQEAKKMADTKSGCSWWPTGAVVVKNNKIIGKGSNPANLIVPCPRWEKKCPTGTGYELCNEICKRVGYAHSEITSIDDSSRKGNDTNGADIYLFGHWWCCEPCWNKMIEAKIKNVYILENADKIFTNKARSKLQEKLLIEKKDGKKHTLDDIKWEI